MVAAIVAAAHWPALRAQARSLDDNLFITDNSLVSQPGWPSTWRFFSEVLHPSSVAGYYLPVTMTSLMLDFAMGGSASDFRTFHRTNLVLHVICTLLVVLLLRQLFGSAIPAGIVGLLFGVHPLTVEPVAWVAQRKTLLAACFGFGSLWTYVRHRRKGGRTWWNASIVLYFLALLSKPSVVTLPLLLLVLDWWPLRRFNRGAVLEKWPFFLLALASSVITVLSQVGTMGPSASPQGGPLRLLLQICYLQIFHLGQILWPRDLSSLHPPPTPIALSNPMIQFSVIAVGLLAVLLVLSVRRSRGPLAGWLFYLVALAPTFGVLAWSVIFAYDSYLYFPGLGLLLIAGAGLGSAWSSSRFRSHGARAFLIAPMILAAAAGFIGTRQTYSHWLSDDTLWQRILNILPGFPAMHAQYGALLIQDQRFGDAIPILHRAIELAPENGEYRFALGLALRLDGRPDAALPEIEMAAALAPNDRQIVRELAMALRQTGRLAEAESRFRQLLRLNPRDADALGQLGTLLALRGEAGQAAELARTAVALEPDNARTYFTQAVILLYTRGADSEVVDLLRKAVRYQPDWADAYNELAWVMATSPDSALFNPSEALRLSRRAVELSDGQDPGVLDTYAAAQAAAGQFGPAVETARGAAGLAATLHADTLVQAIQRRIATYQRGHRFIEERRGRSGR